MLRGWENEGQDTGWVMQTNNTSAVEVEVCTCANRANIVYCNTQPVNILLLQLARRHDQSDAEGVLLRAGAADAQAHHFPGGASPTPVDSALDPAAPTFAPQQESLQPQQNPQQPATQSSQPRGSGPQDSAESAQAAEPQTAAVSDAAASAGSRKQEVEEPAPATAPTAPLAAALGDAAASNGPAEAAAAAPESATEEPQRTAPLAEALRDAAANGPTGLADDTDGAAPQQVLGSAEAQLHAVSRCLGVW